MQTVGELARSVREQPLLAAAEIERMRADLEVLRRENLRLLEEHTLLLRAVEYERAQASQNAELATRYMILVQTGQIQAGSGRSVQ